jgi:hypothetical protein
MKPNKGLNLPKSPDWNSSKEGLMIPSTQVTLTRKGLMRERIPTAGHRRIGLSTVYTGASR